MSIGCLRSVLWPLLPYLSWQSPQNPPLLPQESCLQRRSGHPQRPSRYRRKRWSDAYCESMEESAGVAVRGTTGRFEGQTVILYWRSSVYPRSTQISAVFIKYNTFLVAQRQGLAYGVNHQTGKSLGNRVCVYWSSLPLPLLPVPLQNSSTVPRAIVICFNRSITAALTVIGSVTYLRARGSSPHATCPVLEFFPTADLASPPSEAKKTNTNLEFDCTERVCYMLLSLIPVSVILLFSLVTQL